MIGDIVLAVLIAWFVLWVIVGEVRHRSETRHYRRPR